MTIIEQRHKSDVTISYEHLDKIPIGSSDYDKCRNTCIALSVFTTAFLTITLCLVFIKPLDPKLILEPCVLISDNTTNLKCFTKTGFYECETINSNPFHCNPKAFNTIWGNCTYSKGKTIDYSIFKAGAMCTFKNVNRYQSTESLTNMECCTLTQAR